MDRALRAFRVSCGSRRYPLVTLLLAIVVSVGIPKGAAAANITFDFDCDITGPVCSGIPSIGTIVVSDNTTNANWVDIVLTLNAGNVQSFYLNYDGFPLPAGYNFEATPIGVDVTENGEQADGYNIGFFDLEFPDTGSIGANPATTTLKLTNTTLFANLDALDFAGLTTDGILYAAVQKTQGGWFGAGACYGCEPVPEPATLLLLGAGLAMAGVRRYRLKRKQ